MSLPARKLATIAALAAFTTGLSGYFMGIAQTNRAISARAPSQVSNFKSEIPIAPSGAMEAPRYTDISSRAHHPNHGWTNSLAKLPAAPVFTAATPPLTPDEVDALLLRRVSRRAYSGAPPTVPHPIDQRESTSCLACHGTPTRIGATDVPQISHPPYTHCIQCHAPRSGPGPALAAPPPAQRTPALANAFAGLPPPSSGARAHAGAPPVMPHTTTMRQNCLSCHGPGGSSAIKTTHPQRTNCLQCHATDAARETHPPSLALSVPSAPKVPFR